MRITWSGVASVAASGARGCLLSAGGPGAFVCVCRGLRDELPALDVPVPDAFFFARCVSLALPPAASCGCAAREAAALDVAADGAECANGVHVGGPVRAVWPCSAESVPGKQSANAAGARVGLPCAPIPGNSSCDGGATSFAPPGGGACAAVPGPRLSSVGRGGPSDRPSADAGSPSSSASPNSEPSSSSRALSPCGASVAPSTAASNESHCPGAGAAGACCAGVVSVFDGTGRVIVAVSTERACTAAAAARLLDGPATSAPPSTSALRRFGVRAAGARAPVGR